MEGKEKVSEKVLQFAAIMEYNESYYTVAKVIYELSKGKRTPYVPQQTVALKLAELHESGKIDKKLYTNISKILNRMKKDGLVRKVRAGQLQLVALTDLRRAAVEFLESVEQ